MSPPANILRARRPERALITGGAGFVGTNLAHRLLEQGRRVRILDNLERPGVERNLRWLRARHGDALEVVVDDVRNCRAVQAAVAGTGTVFHLASQVAVTTALERPVVDFDVNARGTLNVLEAARASTPAPGLVFTSTNKVYGDLSDVPLRELSTRYGPRDGRARENGVDESRRLEFHGPYGCSKGAADQYVLDYARSYGLFAVVFRLSCIYGPHQRGTEDQGWVAHFLIRAIEGRGITVYGDGKQVRDLLFVSDLVDAFLRAEGRMEELSGLPFNIGGGSGNATSLLELLDAIETLEGRRLRVAFEPWRPDDQRYYVSDTSRFTGATGWRPRVTLRQGLEALHDWLRAERATGLIAPLARSPRQALQPARQAGVVGA